MTLCPTSMRDAENGAEFRDFLKKRFDIDARTISGDEEARLSALGVLSGFPEADGVVGDHLRGRHPRRTTGGVSRFWASVSKVMPPRRENSS